MERRLGVLRLRGLGLHSIEGRMGQFLERPLLVVLAVGLVVGIPVMVLGQVSADDTRARTRAAQLEAASDAALRGSEALGLRLTNLRETLQFYAGSFEFQNAVWERNEAILRSRHTEMTGVLGAEVATLAITDDKGAVLQGTPSGNVPTQEYFERTRRDATDLRSTRAVVAVIDVPSKESQRLAVAAPIRRAATNFIGVLVAEVRLRDVAEWIQPQLAGSEDLLLIDTRGRLVSQASRPGELTADVTAQAVMRSVLERTKTAAIEGEDPLSGGRRFIGSAPVGDLGLHVVATQSPDALERELGGTLNQLLALRVALVSILLGAAYVVGRAAAGLAQQRRALAATNVQLQDATAAKSRFLASMSHDLRTPLNSIIGFSEVLLEGLFGAINAKQKEYLNDILGSGRHQLQLINDILDLSKVEAGRMEFHPEPVELTELLEGVHSVVRPLAERKGQSLTLEMSDVVTLFHDPVRLKQVVFNLLGNAVKFTPDGGSVTTRAWSDGDGHIQIAVADSGVGIREEDLPKLFEEFERVGAGYSQNQQGTGLGLALVKRFVEIMGGTIAVTSVVGKGSTFTIRLPSCHPGYVLATPEPRG